MDAQNGVVMFVLVAGIVLLALIVLLRPWLRRKMTEDRLKAEAKQKRMEELAAERVAAKFQKKGRL